MSKSLKDVEWKEFLLSEIFKFDLSSGDNQAKLLPVGNTPLVSAGTTNNGICKFILHNDGISQLFPKNTITNDMFGKVFYQPMPYYAVSHGRINILIPKVRFNKYIGLFIKQAIETRFKNKFSYSIMCNQSRLQKQKILLPVTHQNEPDYKFMEEYIKERETKLKEQYKDYIQNRIAKLQKKVETKKEWKEFKLKEIFDIEKGNQNKMNSLIKGDIPLVSAKKFDNGYKNFVKPNNKKIFHGNCISLNNDGDGGAGIAYYQPYKMLLDTHCTALTSKIKLDKYAQLFLSEAITKQRIKFGHGYAINSNRLKIFKIMLPITLDGEPDYEYMEDYMKYLEQQKLLEYLDYIK